MGYEPLAARFLIKGRLRSSDAMVGGGVATLALAENGYTVGIVNFWNSGRSQVYAIVLYSR